VQLESKINFCFVLRGSDIGNVARIDDKTCFVGNSAGLPSRANDGRLAHLARARH
jgi:hypothetical protein